MSNSTLAPAPADSGMRSLLLAVPVAAAISAACWWVGERVGHAPEVAFLRWEGWGTIVVNYLGMLAFVVAILELRVHRKKSRADAEAFRYELLWHDEKTLITKGNVHEIFQRMRALPAEVRQTRLCQAVDLCATKYQVSTSVGEVSAAAEMYLDNESGRSDTSYSLVRYLAWAIPSIGFIGTVMGLSSALGYFEKQPASAPRIVTASIDEKQGADPGSTPAAPSPNPTDEPADNLMSHVAGALMLAFNTTFVALVLAIFLMYDYHRVVEQEEALITRIRDYLLRYFVARAYYPDSRA
jgi:biopolymer transport protein ExbB/TolQ